MPLNANEKLLLEGIRSMLQQDAKLGLSFHDQQDSKAERGYEYLHNQIDDMFELKAVELTHAESICQAFRKVHNYKYLDDPSFNIAMEKEMLSTAVPAADRQKALNFIPSIIDELRAEQRDWAERDSGFNPSLDEIRSASQPVQMDDFEIQKRRLNTKNIDKTKRGDGSPARTSMTQPPLPSDGYDAEINP